MAYDERLAARFRRLVETQTGVTEKRMMGGVCFFVNGHMIGGADCSKAGDKRFMFRVGKENDALAARLPGGNAMIQGGRRMTGLYFIDPASCGRKAIEDWVTLAVGHARSLPAK